MSHEMHAPPRTPLLFLSITVAGLVACSTAQPTRPPDSGVTVSAIGSGLRAHNSLDVPVFYFAYDRERLASLDWAPCVDPQGCANVAPGADVVVPLSRIGGYQAGETREVVFNWWVAQPPATRGQPSTPGPLHQQIVTLQ